jgi:hypothetical protein
MKAMNLIARVGKIIVKSKNYDDAVVKVAKNLMIPIKISASLVRESMQKELEEKNVCVLLQKEKV